MNINQNYQITRTIFFLPRLAAEHEIDANWLKLKNPKIIHSKRPNNNTFNTPKPVSQLDAVLNNDTDDLAMYRVDKKGKNHNKATDILDTKKNKSKVKKKLRTKIHINEEDDNLDSSYIGSIKQAKSLELSIMRPPKPLKKKTIASKILTSSRKNLNHLKNSIYQEKTNIDQINSEKESTIFIDNPLTIQDLSILLKLPEAAIIKWLFLQGVSVTMNQMIDVPMAKSVAKHYGFILTDNLILENNLENNKVKYASSVKDDNPELFIKRSPIVTLFGHVDHGKTTLLNTIRKINESTIEAGGITQSINAYELQIDDVHTKVQEQVIFLDTPGHKAFTAMRRRGAQVTDVGVLVVAADDNLQPQSIEAIKHLQNHKLPFVVAINKIDKSGADISAVKASLVEYGIIEKDSGGNIPIVEVSGLANINIEILLQHILTQAKLQNLQANPKVLASGTILDSHLDRTKGPISHILIQNGTLSIGYYIVVDNVMSKIRAIVSRQGNKVMKAGPSSVVEIWGLTDVLTSGSLFSTAKDEREAKNQLFQQSKTKHLAYTNQHKLNTRITFDSSIRQKEHSGTKQINLILKTDAQGSIEAIIDAFTNIPQSKVQLNLIYIGVGEIRESDIQLASVSKSTIISFNIVPTNNIKTLASKAKVNIHYFAVIYEMIDYIQESMLQLVEIEYSEYIIGHAQVETVFIVSKGSVAGCKVLSGKLKHRASIRVLRDDKILYTGKIDSLKRVKEDIAEISVGNECGVLSIDFDSWQKKDRIEAYESIPKIKEL
uniref:Translation initiation factor IF-2, chloroplastic n=1 Tax=Balbiania investiens TaxID=111861 RepID=A0A4D6BLN8_9FLOR|nr:translation initiation factor 2 [Balbiania investiens]QBX88655.1 translation initiation factor 2 [Balbiania investiens]